MLGTHLWRGRRARWVGLALLTLIGVEAALLALAPAEQTLGQLVKLVYLHGALIRAGLIGFGAAGLVGLGVLLLPRAGLGPWLLALQRGSLLVWLVYLVSSMTVTYLAWGVAVAWGEPRVAATLRITLVALVIFAVTAVVKQPALTAVGNIVLAGVAWWATQSAGVIRHPIDPIGTSSSAAIRGFYVGIVIVMLALFALAVILLWIYQAAPAANVRRG